MLLTRFSNLGDGGKNFLAIVPYGTNDFCVSSGPE